MKQYMSVKEFSDHLGVSAPTIYKCVKKPGFPSMKIGKSIRIDVDLAEQWFYNKL